MRGLYTREDPLRNHRYTFYARTTIVSNLLIIKRVAARAIEAGLGRPLCYYCHKPLYVRNSKCKNCGAPVTPLEGSKKQHSEPPVGKDKKPKRISPAMFMR